jgi:hypothetical protein
MEDVGNLWPFGQFSGHLGYGMAIWFSFPRFGTFYSFWNVVPKRVKYTKLYQTAINYIKWQ